MGLTYQEITQTKPKTKPFKLSDSGGLYLYVTPSGRKTWRLKYRYQGKERTLTIGKFGKTDISLADARVARDDAKRILAQGLDPSSEKKRSKLEKKQRTENTFEAVAKDWWETKKNGWTDKHAGAVLHTLEVNVFPSLGLLPVSEISPQQVLQVIRTIEKRGSLEMASKVLQRCRRVFSFAIIEGKCAVNPATDLKDALKTPEVRHHPSLTAKELPEFLRRLSSYDGHIQTKLATKLTLLTFLRSIELRGGRWEEIDWINKQWNVPAERMKGKKGKKKDHLVPLSRQALAVLGDLQELNGDGGLIFPSERNPAKHISENTILGAFYRMGYHSRATPHGIRTTASTILNEEGFNPDAIERQLAHVPQDKIRGTYNKALYLPEREKMMQWWADYLDNCQNSE